MKWVSLVSLKENICQLVSLSSTLSYLSFSFKGSLSSVAHNTLALQSGYNDQGSSNKKAVGQR